jgi:phosphopantothenoylcysteine synthetase/decarboxylase
MSSSPPSSADEPSTHWQQRKVILGVTGGIACFKSAALVSALAQAGAEVRVAMTPSAQRFVTPLTFQALSGQPVATGIWPGPDAGDCPHIRMARWADLLLIAPATADCIARLAAGICDDIVGLCAAALPASTPVLLAPAMNEQMWQNPVTRRNLSTLGSLSGYHTVGPQSGWQACRTEGEGRMSETDEIMEAAMKLLEEGTAAR